jgi:hypothetical protein
VFDPNMRISLLLGQALEYQLLPLPAPLACVEDRAAFISSIDKPILVDFDGIHQWRDLGVYLAQLAEQTRTVMPELEHDHDRVSVALRLWARCLMAAKAIRPETRAGANSSESRASDFQMIDALAAQDAVYAAGVQSAPAFLTARSQEHSFDGVPPDSQVRRYIDANNTPAGG